MDAIIHEELSNLGLDERQRGAFDELHRLLEEWSRAVRLVGFGDARTLERRYFLDPLYAWESAGYPLHGSRIVDLGSGGGTPGLPMAIAAPETHFDLFESNQRKATFLSTAVSELNLRNVTVHASRYESRLPAQEAGFDGATVRGLRLVPELQDILHRSVRIGAPLLWITSEGKARGHSWGEGWDACPPAQLGKLQDDAWLCWARATARRFT